MSKCYLCQIADPNETHYNPKRHRICLICGVKLWEIAQKGIEFDLRRKTVTLNCKNKKKKASTKKVVLTTGYEVDLAEEKGLEHLFNAVISNVTDRLKNDKELADNFWSVVHDVCVCELHFIAGQLRSIGSSMDIQFLLDQFIVHWDMLAEKLNQKKK